MRDIFEHPWIAPYKQEKQESEWGGIFRLDDSPKDSDGVVSHSSFQHTSTDDTKIPQTDNKESTMPFSYRESKVLMTPFEKSSELGEEYDERDDADESQLEEQKEQQ